MVHETLLDNIQCITMYSNYNKVMLLRNIPNKKSDRCFPQQIKRFLFCILGPCFHYWCSVYGICKWSDTLWPVGRVRLFVDYTISLSSLCRLIWKHWTTKMLVRYMMPSVCLRLRQFSQLSLYSLYGAVCLQLTQWSRECVLCLIIIIKPEVWIINHCLGLGHETMVCAVCLTMFLWICDMTRLLRGTFHVLVVFAPNLVLCHLACSITILLGTLLMSDT